MTAAQGAAQAILVVGMHRSGTSALARVLHLLGADLPRRVVGPGLGNELGHWEPEAAVQLHRDMLADAGSATNSPVEFDPAWFGGRSAAGFEDRIAALVREEYGASRLFVMKEPRAALFLPLWIRALEGMGIQPRFVMPFRDPLEVAQSLATRQRAVFPQSIWPPARGVALWLRYVLAAERSTRGHPRSFVAFDALLRDWQTQLGRISRQLGVAWPREAAQAQAEIDAFLDAQHRRASAPDGEALPPPAALAYAALQGAVDAPNSQADAFDRVSAQVAAGAQLLAPYVAQMERRLEARAAPGGGRAIVFLAGEPGAPAYAARVGHHAAAARRLGHRATEIPLDGVAGREGVIDGADVLVLWRCAWSEAVEAIVRRARAAGTKIIADVDDVILEAVPGAEGPGARLARLEKTIQSADLCIASTRSLMDRLRPLARPLMCLPSGFDEPTLAALQLAAEGRRRSPLRRRVGIWGDADGMAAAQPVLARLQERHPGAEFVRIRSVAPEEVGGLDVMLIRAAGRQSLADAQEELGYVSAALARVPVAARTGGLLAEAITPGVTGFISGSDEEWLADAGKLIDDDRLARAIGDNALHAVLWRHGPESRDARLARALELLFATGARAAELYAAHVADLRPAPFAPPPVPDYQVVFESARREWSAVAVVIPLYNYAQFVEEALDSVKGQTLGPIDVVVVDDCSTDDSQGVARRWLERNCARFNHVALLRNRVNSKLGPTRNAGFSYSSARYVVALDADNALLPGCLATCLAALESSGAAAAFPILQQFGESQALLGAEAWNAPRLACSNFIDAMAMVRKSAWAGCGGYARLYSREDYELWMKFVERGYWAVQVPEVLGRYRVHGASMVRTEDSAQMALLWETLSRAHPWIAVPAWSRTGERWD